MQLELKLNVVCPAETEADSEQMPIETTSSQPCSKPNVGGSFHFKGICSIYYLERGNVFSFKKSQTKYKIKHKEFNENGSSYLYYTTLDDDAEISFEMKDKGKENNVCWWFWYAE